MSLATALPTAVPGPQGRGAWPWRRWTRRPGTPTVSLRIGCSSPARAARWP